MHEPDVNKLTLHNIMDINKSGTVLLFISQNFNHLVTKTIINSTLLVSLAFDKLKKMASIT
jgi:hypothetical protein